MSELGIKMEINWSAARQEDDHDEFVALVRDLGILIRGSGDDAAVEQAIKEEIDFLFEDLSRESYMDLLAFLIAQGAEFTITGPEAGHHPTPSAPYEHLYDDTMNSMEHHGRVRVPA